MTVFFRLIEPFVSYFVVHSFKVGYAIRGIRSVIVFDVDQSEDFRIETEDEYQRVLWCLVKSRAMSIKTRNTLKRHAGHDYASILPVYKALPYAR